MSAYKDLKEAQTLGFTAVQVTFDKIEVDEFLAAVEFVQSEAFRRFERLKDEHQSMQETTIQLQNHRRDRFAAAALTGICQQGFPSNPATKCHEALKIADLMIKMQETTHKSEPLDE